MPSSKPPSSADSFFGQLTSLKRFFSWRELLSNVRALKRARAPLRGYVTTVCFWALMEIGFLDPLAEGAVSRKEFAESRRLNEEILFFVCRYLQRSRYLDMKGDSVAWTPKGLRFWREAFGVFHLFHAYEPLFSSLAIQLRNQAAFGKDLFRREEEVAAGFAELGKSFLFKIMLGIIQREGFRRVVDLGCAEVELSSFLCERNPEIRCLGIDHSPEMIEGAREKIGRLGLGSQIDLVLADMFEIEKAGRDFSDYDVVTAIDLFHGYFWEGEEKLFRLFEKLGRFFRRQHFLISEICLPPMKAMAKIAYPYVEHELFHDLTRQRSFQAGELESLLARSGFVIQKKWNFDKIAARICLLAKPGG
jgi:ubiquinone/menaquinone biosynthesis C-methylase UbiE